MLYTGKLTCGLFFNLLSQLYQIMKFTLRAFIFSVVLIISFHQVHAQRYLSDLDTSLFIKDTLRPFLKRFDNIHFSGYIQPQFQVAESKGSKSYAAGDFSQYSSSRFMLRRARIKLDYFDYTADNLPKVLFTFQFDATERGVFVRDMFLRLYETKGHFFSLTTGLFARPFGYEVNLSSGFRESPERGRMSQILMPVERDLGAMISYEPLGKNAKNHWVKIDAGIFNGPGLSGTTDFDSHKDFIGRITIKPVKLSALEFSGGLSILQGGWRQQSKFVYTSATNTSGEKIFAVDSSLDNIGRVAPRKYYGADAQLKWKHSWGETEIRGEYWSGKQTGNAVSTSNPGTIPEIPQYIRHFNGAFFYLLQDIASHKNQLVLKYDWYDPNTRVKAADIGMTGTNLSAADIKYSTFGIGFTHYFNNFLKAVVYYDIITNEKTQLAGNTTDLKDNIFTFRIQYRF
jgi:hypothetical protein